MALSFPLTRTVFMNTLFITRMTFDLPVPVAMSRTRGGQINTAEIGEALWSGSISLLTNDMGEAQRLRTLLTALQVPGRTFDVYDAFRCRPLSDPTASDLGSENITASSASSLTVGGLPNGFQITAGDYISIGDDTPNGRSLYRFTSDATVSGGSSGAVEVQPFVRGTPNGNCTMNRPYCRALVVPGEVSFGEYRPGITEGISFRFQQTLS